VVEIQGPYAGDPKDLLTQDAGSSLDDHVGLESTEGFCGVGTIYRADADRCLGAGLNRGSRQRPQPGLNLSLITPVN
jgi:hypothetical protein